MAVSTVAQDFQLQLYKGDHTHLNSCLWKIGNTSRKLQAPRMICMYVATFNNRMCLKALVAYNDAAEPPHAPFFSSFHGHERAFGGIRNSTNRMNATSIASLSPGSDHYAMSLLAGAALSCCNSYCLLDRKTHVSWVTRTNARFHPAAYMAFNLQHG